MVAPIRDLENKFAFFSSNMYSQQSFKLLTVLPSNYTGMNITAEYSPDKYDEMRVSQISYSLVVILELSGVLEVQYKEIIMSSINKNN